MREFVQWEVCDVVDWAKCYIMYLKLFHADRMVSAMAQVRLDLGPDALILSTRKVANGVEITAALEDRIDLLPLRADPAAVRGLAYHGVPPHLASILAAGPLFQTLSKNLRFVHLAISQGDRPFLFAGPPGAGKTLTVARLATRLVMNGVQPTVITADGRRAGAAEQLAAYTRLLGLDLIVASHPTTLSRALARRVPGAPVLIDMPGGNPFDSGQNEEMAALVATANARIAVVLPAGLDPGEAGETAAAFVECGAEALIITRLDVARRIGCALSAASAGLALAEAGIGAGAADGLAPLTAELLARRLLEVPTHWEHQT